MEHKSFSVIFHVFVASVPFSSCRVKLLHKHHLLFKFNLMRLSHYSSHRKCCYLVCSSLIHLEKKRDGEPCMRLVMTGVSQCSAGSVCGSVGPPLWHVIYSRVRGTEVTEGAQCDQSPITALQGTSRCSTENSNCCWSSTGVYQTELTLVSCFLLQ